MRHWGIEDEIAGHVKRYELHEFDPIARRYGFHLQHLAGLTYPVGNLLLPISNYLVRKRESAKKSLTLRERTILSGNREVIFKTDFPAGFASVLNPVTLYPFHMLQKLFRKHSNSMVIYAELKNP
jgi:hypothetical protein